MHALTQNTPLPVHTEYHWSEEPELDIAEKIKRNKQERYGRRVLIRLLLVAETKNIQQRLSS